MNKIFTKTIFLIFIILFALSNISFADDFLEEIEYDDFLETTTQTTEEPIINSKNAVVIDRKTLSVLYEKQAYEKVAMASTTKIMTCILALENSSMNEIVTVSKKAATIHGSTLGIKSESQITMQDLLYGLMLRSGNDCAIAIAEHISGSVEDFANLMNKKAEELELLNTHFVTPHGLDDDHHYTTAYELAILTNYALQNDIFKQIVSCKTYTVTMNGYSKTISNTNELLGNLNGVYGVKTGFTFNAGRCLVSSCKRDSLDIIVVILGANTKKIRTIDSKNMIEYIFSHYQYFDTYSLLEKNFNNYIKFFEKNVITQKTTEMPLLEIVGINNYIYPLTKNEIVNLSTKIHSIMKFSPNVHQNSKVGFISVCVGSKILYTVDIILKNELKANNWNFYFNEIFKNYFESILLL